MPTYQEKWKKENIQAFQFTASKNSQLPEAIKKAAENNGISPSAYVKKATIEKLIKDGYLSEKSVFQGPNGLIVK